MAPPPDDIPSEVIEFLQRRELIEPLVLVREVTFRLDAIPDVKIGVRVWFDPRARRDPYNYQLSHYARTPIQASAYVSSRNGFATEEIALDQAIHHGIITWVEGAIREGHSPDPSWLKPAGNYDQLNYDEDE